MLFVLDRQENVVSILKNSGQGCTPFFDDLLTEDLSTGSETFEFTTVSKNNIEKHLVVGNFIAFKKGKNYKLFQIMQVEEDHQEELYITVYCECAGLQLINSVFRGANMVSASFDRVISSLLSDTPWSVGALPYGLATTFDLEIPEATVYSLLQTYSKQYGVELEFRVEINNGKISKKYVDGYYHRGRVTGKRFTYQRDIESIVRKVDATELYTALIGKGNNGINFRDVTVEGIDKPLGQDFVANKEAYEKYNSNGYHIVGTFEYDTEDAKVLLKKTNERLQEVCNPKIEYTISVLLLSELLGENWNDVSIGDTISVFDNAFYPPIMVTARVSKLETSMTNKDANKCTLANFVEVQSNITSEMRKIAAELQGYTDKAIENKFPIAGSDIQDDAIKENHIYRDSITTEHLQANSIKSDHIDANQILAEHIKANEITAEHIQSGSITANELEAAIIKADSALIQDGALGTAQIADAAITNAKIGKLAVGEANIKDAAITNAKIKDLNAEKITAGDISADRIKTNVISAVNASIGSAKIDSAKIGNLSANKITSGDIATDRLKANAINAVNATVGNATINAAKIGNLSADKITTGDISADRMKTNAISAINASIGSAVISSAKIGNLDASKITTGTLNADRIGAKSIDASKIKAETISSIEVNAGNIVANKIASGDIKVGNANIVDGSISGAKISKATITNAHINSAFVADAYIKNLDATKITSGTLDASKITVKNLKADSIVAGAITVQGENLIHNTDFKKDLSYWYAGGASIDTSVKYEGKNTIKFSNTTATSDIWSNTLSEIVPCVAGETFVASAYMKVQNNNSNVYLGLEFFNSAKTRIARFVDTQKGNCDFRRFVASGAAPSDAAYVRIRMEVQRQATVNATMFMLSRGTIASMWKPHTDEMISSGAITNDKIGNNAITSDKLNVDELFVGDNAFINKLKVVEIDAGQITTGKISSERIDINGLVSFESFNDEVMNIFDTSGDKTYINGGMIATNSISADKINAKGLTVIGKNNTPTFAVSQEGDIMVDGLLKSANFDVDKNTGYKISTDGKAILNEAEIHGDVKLANAGITNYGATIGNENLLMNSDFTLDLSKGWETHDMSSGGTNKSIGKLSGGRWIPVGLTALCIRGTNTTNRYGVVQSVELEPNTKYTISGYCAGHRTGDVQVNIRDCDNGMGNIYTKNYSPKLGGLDLSNEWTRFETTFTTKSSTSYAVNLYSKSMQDNGFAWFLNVKLEKGEKATPWCASRNDQVNYTRFWAGTSYENRDNAPFRVMQDGSVYAFNGTYEGLLRGRLDSGDVQIYENALTIHSPNTETEIIRMDANRCLFNTDFSLNNKIDYSKGNNVLNINDTELKINTSSGYTNYGINNTNGFDLTAKSGGGKHFIRHSTSSDHKGTLLFMSEGSAGTYGDFSFMRKGETDDVRVDIGGELIVRSKIKGKSNNMEMRTTSDGFAFYSV